MRPFLFLLGLSLPLSAQFDPFIPNGVPKLKDGKPNMTAPAPKANGKPDFTGVWWSKSPFDENDQSDARQAAGLPPFINIAAPLPPTAPPMRPEGLRLFGERAQGLGKDLPLTKCLPTSVPMGYLIPVPTKFIHTPDVLAMLFEETNSFRQIFLDGRPLPKEPVPSWMGYSVGRWDGDALVIESSGFNDKTWLDGVGHPRSEAHRMTERIRRPDFGHLNIQITFDDPKYYEKPWTTSVTLELYAEGEPLEKICLENEKDLAHLGAQ
jgi:hypothetical protein